MLRIKKNIVLIIIITVLSCKQNNTNILFSSDDNSIKIDTLTFLKTSNSLDKINVVLYEWYKKRDNKKVKKLKHSYKENLVKRIPITNSNIDNYLQINFFLAFLDSKFNDESIYQLFNGDIEPSNKAFKYVEYPFNYKENKIETILDKITIKRKDSLWIKYYLEEEGINNMLLFYDSDKAKNISYYKKLLNIIEKPPINLHFTNTKEIIMNIESQSVFKNEWQGTYSFEYGRTQMGESIGAVTTFTVNTNNVQSHTLGDVDIDITDNQGNVIGHKKGRKIDRKEHYNIVLAKQDTLKIVHSENPKEEHVLYKDKANHYFIKGSAYFVPAPDLAYPLMVKK